jgi:hypothetical protein
LQEKGKEFEFKMIFSLISTEERRKERKSMKPKGGEREREIGGGERYYNTIHGI